MSCDKWGPEVPRDVGSFGCKKLQKASVWFCGSVLRLIRIDLVVCRCCCKESALREAGDDDDDGENGRCCLDFGSISVSCAQRSRKTRFGGSVRANKGETNDRCKHRVVTVLSAGSTILSLSSLSRSVFPIPGCPCNNTHSDCPESHTRSMASARRWYCAGRRRRRWRGRRGFGSCCAGFFCSPSNQTATFPLSLLLLSSMASVDATSFWSVPLSISLYSSLSFVV